MSTQIKVKCIDQTLTLVSTPLIASGGINEDVIEFSFCEKWDGFSKTAVFYRNPQNAYYSLISETGACIIPQEVLDTEGTLFFGIFGNNDNGVTRTSEVIKYAIKEGAITNNLKPSDPTPSIYEQLLSKYQELAGGKVSKTDIVDNLTTDDATKVLSARQGKILKDEIDKKINTSDIIDSLISSDTDKPLSAKQGKTLKDEVSMKQATLVSGVNIKTINGESLLGNGDMPIESGSSSTIYSNIPVNATPVPLSNYCAWDTQHLYGYKATIVVNGLTDNSLIQNIIMTDDLLASIGYIATTGSNSLTFYTQDNTALSGTIITLVTSEVL